MDILTYARRAALHQSIDVMKFFFPQANGNGWNWNGFEPL